MRCLPVCLVASVFAAAQAGAQPRSGPVLAGGPHLPAEAAPMPAAIAAAGPVHAAGPIHDGGVGPGVAAPWPYTRGPVEPSAFFAPPGFCTWGGECCPPLFWANAEYILWWTKGAPLGPPLATSSRIDPFLDLANTGGLNDPNTVVLIGNSTAQYGPSSGIRFGGGFNLASCLGVEASAFLLTTQQETRSVASNELGIPFILRPFYNVATANPNGGYFIAIEGNFAGNVTVHSETQLWGLDGNLSWNVHGGGPGFVTLLAGYRFLQLREDLLISSPSRLIEPFGSFTYPGGNGTLLGPGDLITVNDNFSTRNQFHGGQVGVRAEGRCGKLILSGAAKVAIGVTNQHSIIQGNSAAADFTNGTLNNYIPFPIGLLAVGSNIGHYSRNVFAVVPELSAQVGYMVMPNVRAFVGYNFLFWSNVIRPGDQISLVLNDVQTPLSPAFGIETGGIPTPTVPFKESSFWAQGINLGLEFRY